MPLFLGHVTMLQCAHSGKLIESKQLSQQILDRWRYDVTVVHNLRKTSYRVPKNDRVRHARTILPYAQLSQSDYAVLHAAAVIMTAGKNTGVALSIQQASTAEYRRKRNGSSVPQRDIRACPSACVKRRIYAASIEYLHVPACLCPRYFYVNSASGSRHTWGEQRPRASYMPQVVVMG